jgi:hypothetical protein
MPGVPITPKGLLQGGISPVATGSYLGRGVPPRGEPVMSLAELLRLLDETREDRV